MKEQKKSQESLVPPEIIALRDQFRERREQSLLDAAATVVSLNTIIHSDAIDYDVITPQMREAFELAFPNDDLAERLTNLDSDNAAQLTGFMNNWRGKYFEVRVRDELNSTGQVGDLVLSDGQSAVLAPDINQPGWDLMIVSESGVPVSEIQLKATDSVSYVKNALERYPDVEVLTTEAASDSSSVIDSAVDIVRTQAINIATDELNSRVSAFANEMEDSPLQDAIEAVGLGLPVLMTVGAGGVMWLTGRQTLGQAVSRSIDQAVESGTTEAVDALLALTGAGYVPVWLTR